MEAVNHKASLARYIEQLVEDYQGQPLIPSTRKGKADDLEMHPNASQPLYYDAPPSSLQTLRMINKSRPAVIQRTYPIVEQG